MFLYGFTLVFFPEFPTQPNFFNRNYVNTCQLKALDRVM